MWRTRFRYFEKSTITATFDACPARLVPPPRESTGASGARQVLGGAPPPARAEGGGGDRRRAVRRQVDPVGGGEPAHRQEAGDATAARHVGLQAVDGVEQVDEVPRDVRVLARRDLEAARG